MKRNAIVIDDDPDFRGILTCLLGGEFEVRSSGDAEGGLRLCGAEPPQLLMLDMCLPDRDGLGVLARLAADPRTAGVPVVVFSAGRVSLPVREALRARGVVRVLDKLAHPREFLSAALEAASG